jgi:hypothetical protein
MKPDRQGRRAAQKAIDCAQQWVDMVDAAAMVDAVANGATGAQLEQLKRCLERLERLARAGVLEVECHVRSRRAAQRRTRRNLDGVEQLARDMGGDS